MSPDSTDQLPPVRDDQPKNRWVAPALALSLMLALAVLLGVLLNGNIPRVLEPVTGPTVAPTAEPSPGSAAPPNPADEVCNAMRERGVRDVLLTYDFPVETPEEARALVESAVSERCPEFKEETAARLAG